MACGKLSGVCAREVPNLMWIAKNTRDFRVRQMCSMQGISQMCMVTVVSWASTVYANTKTKNRKTQSWEQKKDDAEIAGGLGVNG